MKIFKWPFTRKVKPQADLNVIDPIVRVGHVQGYCTYCASQGLPGQGGFTVAYTKTGKRSRPKCKRCGLSQH